MRWRILALALVILPVVAFGQGAMLSGTWQVESQFRHYLGSFSADEWGLQPFTGDKETQAIRSITFSGSGLASIELADGSSVATFYRASAFGAKLQPQGGRDTDLFLQPIAGGKLIGALTWTVPEESYIQLLLILARPTTP